MSEERAYYKIERHGPCPGCRFARAKHCARRGGNYYRYALGAMPPITCCPDRRERRAKREQSAASVAA